MNGDHLTVPQAAPMPALDVISLRPFLEQAAGVHMALKVPARLLTMAPDEIAKVLSAAESGQGPAAGSKVVEGADPEHPAGILAELMQCREWLDGLSEVLDCTEDRIIAALSNRRMQP